MAKYITPGKLMIQDENLGLLSRPKKAALSGQTKNSKVDGKKVGLVPTGRKALNDITNKNASVFVEASSRKKSAPKEEQEINVKEEMFLHDHKKCIEAQKAAMNTLNLDMVLPQDDSMPILEQTKVPQSPRCYPEPEELPMSKFSYWLDSSIQRSCPPSPPPFLWDTAPSSPISWDDEAFEFVLKEEEVDA
ncbi:hypothetical protein K1719_014757 [Acacia pycnantha]|nr:hypothetical protein K1719_014757 [Acacia pycnantha]